MDAREVCLCKITNRADLRRGQLARRRAADRIQRAHRQRPELLRNFRCKQGVNLIWLFKIARHLRQQLIGCDADVDREAKLGENRVLDRVRNGDGVRIQKTGASHIKKAFVDRHLLYDRREAAADGNKCFGVSGVQPEIRFGQNELRAFAQRHSDRLSGCNAKLFAGMDLARITPVRLSRSPPMAEGMRRRSGSPSATRRAASQDRNALLTST